MIRHRLRVADVRPVSAPRLVRSSQKDRLCLGVLSGVWLGESEGGTRSCEGEAGESGVGREEGKEEEEEARHGD